MRTPKDSADPARSFFLMSNNVPFPAKNRTAPVAEQFPYRYPFAPVPGDFVPVIE
jgi:hypothetical protein